MRAEAAHKVLQAHGLPGVLLLVGIMEIRHDEGSGWFEAKLPEECMVQFAVGLLYNATVARVINYGQIAWLLRVSVHDLFL
ncbi:hypothetical protein E2562_003065 [Oryza meyeriana var. granulata]|uniref:Uncharacterized protein n=1 Tax=Oryza meyeriana var. granulata TaxID=110450 RepID=A0A6G1E9Y8_9ORYZ|nr:hypothetical protein E2562_003065 [Oryza meyeriana var. granulata]